MKSKLIKFHFIILLILVINFIIGLLLNFELNNYVNIGLKILLYGSALIGFFLSLKPFRTVAIYFSLYVICSLCFLLGYLFKGSLVAIIGGIFGLLLFIFPPLYEDNNYEIHSYSSLLGTCCQYEVYENYYPFIHSKGKFNYTKFTDIDGKQEEDLAPFSGVEKIKNIKIEKDSIFIDFEDNSSRSFELY